MHRDDNFPENFTFDEAKETIVSLRRHLFSVPFLCSSVAIAVSNEPDLFGYLLIGGFVFVLSSIVLYVLIMLGVANTTKLFRVPSWMQYALAFLLPILFRALFSLWVQ
jgi:hypothetical protein